MLEMLFAVYKNNINTREYVELNGHIMHELCVYALNVGNKNALGIKINKNNILNKIYSVVLY